MALMNWNPGSRYKLFGNLIRSNKDAIFAFDLTIPEVCENPVNTDNRSMQAAASNGYTVFPRRAAKNTLHKTDYHLQPHHCIRLYFL